MTRFCLLNISCFLGYLLFLALFCLSCLVDLSLTFPTVSSQSTTLTEETYRSCLLLYWTHFISGNLEFVCVKILHGKVLGVISSLGNGPCLGIRDVGFLNFLG